MESTRTWSRRYAQRLTITDGLVVAWALTGAHVIRFGTRNPGVGGGSTQPVQEAGYVGVSVALWLAWMAALALAATRDKRVVGSGPEEYRRLLDATFKVFGVFAIVAFALQLSVARGYLLIALPVGAVGLVAARWLWRQWLHVRRRAGQWAHRVIVVADQAHAQELVGVLRSTPNAGFAVVGVVDPAGDGLSQVPARVAETAADAVAVAAGSGMPPQSLRRLGWALEGSDVDMLVSPALTDVAGPRIHVHPVAGLPLLHVAPPEIPRMGAVAKSAFDRVGAALLLVLLAPVLLVAAIAVRLSDPGPVFYRQERIGLDGALFGVWKFRTMPVEADAQLQCLLARQGRAGAPLFKVDDDPRVTRVGRLLRKYSVDEMPQLFNVRPQRAAEVALYDDAAHRRLRALPGMTGLWQVSGRSNLSWEQAVRLDLYYVENWSFTFDLVLLWRTVAVVVRGEGAR
jgi:exopolysaccharide biosynthesis polyprenyl glycosylphosphotransferase